MSDNKSIPEGWAKVKSKSRPGKFYYFNSNLNRSVWNIDDIDKNDSVTENNGKQRRRSYGNSKKTPEKISNGTSNQSKAIRKNIANDRMKKLQKALKLEIEQNEEVSTKKSAKSKILETHSPLKIDSSNKNIASKRLEKIKGQLKKELKDHANSELVTSAISVGEEPNQPIGNNGGPVEGNDVEMMDISFEELPVPDDLFPMDWEQIPEEIVQLEIEKIRQDVHSKPVEQTLEIRTLSPSQKAEFYIVVDTNVLISNLDFVKTIKGKYLKSKHRYSKL